MRATLLPRRSFSSVHPGALRLLFLRASGALSSPGKSPCRPSHPLFLPRADRHPFRVSQPRGFARGASRRIPDILLLRDSVRQIMKLREGILPIVAIDFLVRPGATVRASPEQEKSFESERMRAVAASAASCALIRMLSTPLGRSENCIKKLF